MYTFVNIYFLLCCILVNTSCASEYNGDCSMLLDLFAHSSADFMLCSINNAKPIKMCLSCYEYYQSVVMFHNFILQLSDSDNKTCRERLINLDRLELIEAGFNYVDQLWDKGRCINCFNSSNIVSDYIVTFQKLYNDTNDCLLKFYNEENNTYFDGACRNCSSVYYEMNWYYDRLKSIYGDGQLCIDVVDAMNVTQNFWSLGLHCGRETMKLEIPLVALWVTFLTIPILFYLTVWFFSSTEPSLVSRQKRLQTRLLARFRGRTESSISQFRR